MFAILRNIGFGSIFKVISFISIAGFAWWSDNKADNAEAEKVQLASHLAVLKNSNINNTHTINALQKQIKQQALLMSKRRELVNAITTKTVEKKTQLTQLIKGRTDEDTVKWADQPVPNVVISLLKLKPP
jgi:hypothetical protein